jgi:uncharacterized OB-fold protein
MNLVSELPSPSPDIDDAPFWAAIAERRLVFQRCTDCGLHRHPPGPMCPRCQSTRCDWREAPTSGELFSYTITHVAPHPALGEHLPYVIGLVRFPTCDDVRLVTNIVDTPLAALKIGIPVEAVWTRFGSALVLPRFRARRPAA